jgi:hypothetical protein
VAASELLDAGHRVTVFERSSEVGGVWVYDEAPGRTMYASLRTNLPRDLMAFRSYPFDARGGGEDDWPRFPSHRHVLEYLQRFATDRDLGSVIEFDTPIERVAPRVDGWEITVRRDGEAESCGFDAVAVCNGHFSVPRQLDFDGAAEFSGVITHSRDYRHPQRFAGQRVAVVGTGSSGFDLAVEIASVAEEVFWCGQDFGAIHPFPGVENLSTAPMPDSLSGDGMTAGGESIGIDAMLLCTGFHYDLSIIDGHVASGEDAPSGLYRHLLPISHPTMALIGIPQRIIPFPLFEMQAKWFAALLSGHVELPGLDQRRTWLGDWERHCLDAGREPYQFRNIGEEQFDYIDQLALECGADVLPDWYRAVAHQTQQSRVAHPLDYRDRPIAARGDSRIPADS